MTNIRKEEIILSALTSDSTFAKKVIPHIKAEFFQDRSEKVVYTLIQEFWNKYTKLPSKDVLNLLLSESDNIPEADFDGAKESLKAAFTDKYEYDEQWLIDTSEQFCRDRAIYIAIMAAVQIINKEDKKRTEGEIPKLLSDALAIQFDRNIGHDYFEQSDDRWEYYNKKTAKIPFLLERFNKVTNGGAERKTINFFVAPPKAGKSTALCSLAADYLRQGYNVLYITLELAEEKIAVRIDANLMNIPMLDVQTLDKDVFLSRVSNLKIKTQGKLKIKEYSPKTANVNHFRALLDDLKIKDGFEPDVIVVDYLGICGSAQYMNSSKANSYTYQQSVGEELRALMVDYNCMGWSALQTNRGGMNNSDFEVTDIADSTGPLQICDFAAGIIRTPDLDEMNQVIIKILASRYSSSSGKFVLGVDLLRMKLYTVEDSAQDGISGNQNQQKQSSKAEVDRYSKQRESLDWDID